MTDITVELLQHSNLGVAIVGVRNCYDSISASDTLNNMTEYEKDIFTNEWWLSNENKLATKDKNLLLQMIDNRHTSTLEHISYTFYLQNIPRCVLQELVRHRLASYSVKSTRYTLVKQLKNEQQFDYSPQSIQRARKYILIDDDSDTILINRQIDQLEILRQYIVLNDITKSDRVKMLVPESFLTNVVVSINVRSLRNLLNLRTHSTAYKYIRELSNKIYNALPETHKFLYKDVIHI